MCTVITFGTFDIFHVGHLRLLQRARSLGSTLIVGVSSDSLNYQKKSRTPIYSELDRQEILKGLGCVDQVFLEESLELKRRYVEKYGASLLVMGEDWEGEFDDLSDLCKVIYLPRTHSISTTATIEVVMNKGLRSGA